MFLIVENESVVLGPMEWRKNYFESCLRDDCDISFLLPKTNPDRTPFIVSETVRIIPVTDIGISNSFDPETQWLNGPFYNFFEDRAEMYHTAYDKPLEVFKNEKKAEVAASRYKYENGGIFLTIQNQEVFVYTSREDRNIYIQAFQLGADQVSWKFGEIFLTLSNEELGYIVSQSMIHIQAVFDWEKVKRNEIDATSTLEEVKMIQTISDNPNWERGFI